MIDAIGASFLSTLIQANTSLLSSHRQINPAEKTKDQQHITRNTDATGLQISEEARRALETLKQVHASDQSGEKSGQSSAAGIFSNLLSSKAVYPTYNARGDFGNAAALFASSSLNSAFFSTSEPTISAEKASAIYRSISGETSLAPWGTGISLEI